MSKSNFDASASALGYLFQVRFALLIALKRLRKEPEVEIYLETLDDVVLNLDGTPLEILQTKHHVNALADLTDQSSDLWKTLRIWAEAKKSGAVQDSTRFVLVTNSTAKSNSAVSLLREEDRDPAAAVLVLENVARTSENEGNKKAFEAFLSLRKEDRSGLFEQVFVIDKFSPIEKIDDLLATELALVVDRGSMRSFLQRIEGWWLGRVISHFREKAPRTPILGKEVEAVVSDFREQFKADALPIDPELLSVDVDHAAYQDRPFVAQLKLINLGQSRIKYAIRDFYRAYEQRSRWLREELLYVGEIERYQDRLMEEWERRFERMKERLGERSAEEIRKKEGRELYTWAEETLYHIRPGCTEPFVSRGSFQILANQGTVGWHSNFRERLKKVLGSAEAAA
jgi:hypothetical protein